MIEMLERPTTVDARRSALADASVDLGNGWGGECRATLPRAPRSMVGNGVGPAVSSDVLPVVCPHVLAIPLAVEPHVFTLLSQTGLSVRVCIASILVICEDTRFAPRKVSTGSRLVAMECGLRLHGEAFRTRVHSVSITRKSNALTLAGWRLLRFHGDQVRSGEAVALIRQALESADA